MYFQIENTPEHIRRARRAPTVQSKSPKEDNPRLILAPFNKPPQVIFESVVIGTSCERTLEIFNPTKQVQQVTFGQTLPSGLTIQLAGDWLVLEPESCYYVNLVWTPIQPTSLRETIHFTNEKRGRYDVIVVLKTSMNIKVRGNNVKGFKISPGKTKKKPHKKSPVAVYKKKSEIIYNTTKIKKSVTSIESTQHRILQPSSKDNRFLDYDYASNLQIEKCPFDSSTSIDFNFDTSEIFSNMRQIKSQNIMQQTYDKSCGNITQNQNNQKPTKHIHNKSGSDNIFDNLTFTPLKVLSMKNEKLDKGPKIILSMNSESEFDDSLNMNNSNKENETHSIMSITATQPPNRFITVNHHTQIDRQFIETPSIQNKKIPNTSSPKEFNSPNFSINTELSRISDLSFFPQRFSTEKKVLPRMNNDTHDIIDDANIKLSSDTYTKDSPDALLNFQMYTLESKPPNYFMRDQQPKMCKQSLFKEYQQVREIREKNILQPIDPLNWQNDLKTPTRSDSPPPLQSIPEESTHFYDTQILDKTDKQMTTFTINRSVNTHEISRRLTWSKKSIRAEPELWKVPVSRKSLKPKPNLLNKDSLGGKISNASNMSITNLIPNVYSQSSTLDPFSSTTYFYDEDAVHKIEIEFKRWLNCILTPPADLESNIEQKIDVGKAWLENRNKDVPLAPTKEHVSSIYHNSHRLECLRRSARALLLSPEVTQVFQKLNAQIEKKLIAIRTDRNLHLDIGLQKFILELLLSYNPLWLRLGLEAIYGVILPLKSNSDIEGLTTFIVQRLFKNPHLRAKNSKSSAPNMLSPAYMEAIKKFTLKKFFMLVYFLDQAKQRKIISHDPCLFCRNAVCKESREIIIRFTRDLIAGIGDITKHLRPLGYVVSHKQTYLDEYKYAVNNIATDLRDGVRLTKVMEIILIKTGLLHQLRTPAISRLQKIHNVQVALNALKEANFVIVGDIGANDISDGHREKTLSLLWQLIHVFRAPLFEQAANVIQMWWKKKYQVIVEERIKEEKQRQHFENNAKLIQRWWRRIQYNRLVEWQMRQIECATIVIQKYCRKWLLQSQYRKMKASVLKIKAWYRSRKMITEAKRTLVCLRQEKEKLQQKCAVIIQSYVRRWLCKKEYRSTMKKVIVIQSLVRTYLLRQQYMMLKNTTVYVQRKYRGKLLMKSAIKNLETKRNSALIIQRNYRMLVEYRKYHTLKNYVKIIQTRYRAMNKMRQARQQYETLRRSVIMAQSLYRARQARAQYLLHRNSIVKLQRRIRAHQQMKLDRAHYLRIKKAATIIQIHFKSYLIMKSIRSTYILKRASATIIQSYYRSYVIAKAQRAQFVEIRRATLILQKHYKNLLLMRGERTSFLTKRNAAVCLQRRYRALVSKRQSQNTYRSLKTSAICIQRRYRALVQMRTERAQYLRLKHACTNIQQYYRALLTGRHDRKQYLDSKLAAIKIQNWFRNCRRGKEVKQHYEQAKKATMVIQRTFRAYIVGSQQRKEYIRIKTATIRIQTYYRSYVTMRRVRTQYLRLKTATITIQKYYKSCVETKKHRESFLRMKTAVHLIGNRYLQYKENKKVRLEFCTLRSSTILIQRRFRSLCIMRQERKAYLLYQTSVTRIQQRFKALLLMRKERNSYRRLYDAVLAIQRRFKAQALMKQERHKYLTTLAACKRIQNRYRAYRAGKLQLENYLQLKHSCIVIQRRYRALLTMRAERMTYLKLRSAIITLQNKYRAHLLMVKARTRYLAVQNACVVIQRFYIAYSLGKKQRKQYVDMKSAATCIQRYYKCLRGSRAVRRDYLRTKNAALLIQHRFRTIKAIREARRNHAASKVQMWYRCVLKRNANRQTFLHLRACTVKLQTFYRMHVQRKKFLELRQSTIKIQRFYRSWKLTSMAKREYLQTIQSVIKIQALVKCHIARSNYLRMRGAALKIQAAFREKKHRDHVKATRVAATICLQSYIRRYIVQSRYRLYREKIVFLQRLWRGKLVTRLMRYEFLNTRNNVIRLQAMIRGYLVRKQMKLKKEQLSKVKEEKRLFWAAAKIQAVFRGHLARIRTEKRVAELRRRWRDGALKSTQETLKERNAEAMDVLRNMSDIETVIRAFRSLELLTEVFPMMYHDIASSIVRRVNIYMSLTNRSISSIQVLKSAASVLVNLTRYRITGPKIYSRDHIPPILKFMWRFSNGEIELFCILSTYIWLFSKYDAVKQDLTELLHTPENHKMLSSIRSNVLRMKKMASNSSRGRMYTPQSTKFVSHTGNQSLNYSTHTSHSDCESRLLPSLEPDYGIIRADKPRYFEDARQAIDCLFHTYKL